jgi:hypothetical protein
LLCLSRVQLQTLSKILGPPIDCASGVFQKTQKRI